MPFTPNTAEYEAHRIAKAVEFLAQLIDVNGRLPVDANMAQADREAITGTPSKTLADIVKTLADVIATLKCSGAFAVVSSGRTASVAGAVAITLHASTVCEFFKFWLDAGSSSVRVNPSGSVADVDTVKYDDTMGVQTIRLATPATTITVFFDGAIGNLNWIAGN